MSTNDGRITRTCEVYWRMVRLAKLGSQPGRQRTLADLGQKNKSDARKRDGKKGFRRDELIGLINEASRTFQPVDDSFVNYVPWNYIAMVVRGITMNRV